MKKKIFLTFICLLSLITLFNYSNVQASSMSDFEAFTTEEITTNTNTDNQKIMKYDSKTKTATEVDMNEIRQVLKSKNSHSYNSSSTSSYIPKLKDYSNTLSPFSTRISYYNRIDNTGDYPYCTISKITTANGSGSGTIIGRNVAITVAHVVMDGNCNIYDDLTIMPAYNNGLYRDDYIAGWSTVYYTNNWATDHGAQNDWAIIVLDRNIGDTTGWCGIQSYGSDSSLFNKNGYAYGYPGGQSLGYTEYQWSTSGNISYVDSGMFNINTLFVGGISGGPVYLNVDDAMIVGMCKGYYTDVNDLSLCTRITQNMVDIVNGL